MPAAAWFGNGRRNNANVEERGDHEHQQLTYHQFEQLGNRKGGRRWEFDVEVDLGRTGGWRPGNPRFPARWGSRLQLEGLGRKLGRWASFGCEGFGIHGGLVARFWIARVVC